MGECSGRLGGKFFGDRAFYMSVLAIIVPVVIQNSISNFVNLLDNIMVGAVSTEQMNGVSIGNQLIFVFSLCVFGGVSAPTIFGAQFYGAGDIKGVRDSFRCAMLVALTLVAVAVGALLLKGEALLMLYINDAENIENVNETLSAGKAYLNIMLIGLLPFAVSQAYAGMLRSTGETKLPMYASVISVLANLALNYIFIFGRLGVPPLKARGAAVATVISRFLEAGIIIVCAHMRARGRGARFAQVRLLSRVRRAPARSDASKCAFLAGAYSRFSIPGKLARAISIKGLPLLLNEMLWSTGMATLARQYSLRGLEVVAANNITTTLSNVFNVFFMSMGTAAAVLIGQSLGATDVIKARKQAGWLISLSIMICLCVGLILFSLAPALPYLFASAGARERALATALMRVCACAMPIFGFSHCCYFILRSGGRVGITFLFDSAYTWLLPVPLAMALVKYTQLDIVPIYALCQAIGILKVFVGYTLVRKGVWIRNIVT